mmetsp:Transcript_26936/g.27166  ORF Transcript_26936/g.27166 Transcript_26936/m.27166 type:complete len:175 (+) Transcript_26936:121-645(+)
MCASRIPGRALIKSKLQQQHLYIQNENQTVRSERQNSPSYMASMIDFKSETLFSNIKRFDIEHNIHIRSQANNLNQIDINLLKLRFESDVNLSDSSSQESFYSLPNSCLNSNVNSNISTTSIYDNSLSGIYLCDLETGQEYNLIENIPKDIELTCIQYDGMDVNNIEYPLSLRF